MCIDLKYDKKVTPKCRGRFRIYGEPTAEVEAVLAELLPDPDRILEKSEGIDSPWRSKATDKGKVRICGQSYFLKRYNCMGWSYRLKNIFRPSKALRSWLAVEEFFARDIPTPLPLLCLEERELRFLGRSYLLFPFVQGETGSFLDLWPELSFEERDASLVQLAEVLGRMHRQGLYHGDLNWRNILARRNEQGLEFFLVDLDGYRITWRPTEAHALRDLEHFLRDLRRAEAGEKREKDFLSKWRQAQESFA